MGFSAAGDLLFVFVTGVLSPLLQFQHSLTEAEKRARASRAASWVLR